MVSNVQQRTGQLKLRWHPFAVVFAGALILISLAGISSLQELVTLLFVITGGFLLTRVSLPEIFTMFRFFIWMLPVTFLVHLLFTPDGMNFITFLVEGEFHLELITNALLFTIKIFGFIFLMGGVLQLLKIDRLIDALTQISGRFPNEGGVMNGIIQMFNIGIRFFPLLRQEASVLQDARRGLGLNAESTLKGKIHNQINSIIPLFIGTIHRGETLTQTMHLRGFRSDKKRTTAHPVQWNKQDGLLVIGALGLSIVLVVL